MSENLTDEEIEKYREAGKIVSRALKNAKEMVEPGTRLIDIAESVEKEMPNETWH
mgnify:CR=1 FL=1